MRLCSGAMLLPRDLNEYYAVKEIQGTPFCAQLTLINILITFLNSSQIILNDLFLSTSKQKVQLSEKPPRWFTDAQQGTDVSQHVNRLHSPPHLHPLRGCEGAAHHRLSIQSYSWTAQAAVGRELDGPLLRSLLLLPQAEPDAVFTLLITGEGPADRRAITDSPQAQGWERYRHPPLSPKCEGNVQLSLGSLHWQNPRAQREILKT